MVKAISSNLRKSRIELGYNQADICLKTGINITSYCQIEQGKTSPRPKTVKLICDFFNKSFDDIFEIVEKDGEKVG